jgi:hypothetical protein
MSDDPRIQAAINAYLSVCDVGIDVDHEAIRAALTAADAAAWQPREMRYVHDVGCRMWRMSMSGLTDELRTHDGGLGARALMERAADALDAAATWQPTHRHRKTGGLYRIVTEGWIESSKIRCVVYEDKDHCTWVRPAAEFYDGRFHALPTPPITPGPQS